MGDAGSAGALFWLAIQNHNVIAVEGAAWEVQATTGKPIPLDFALALTHLYGEKRDGRYEASRSPVPQSLHRGGEALTC